MARIVEEIDSYKSLVSDFEMEQYSCSYGPNSELQSQTKREEWIY